MIDLVARTGWFSIAAGETAVLHRSFVSLFPPNFDAPSMSVVEVKELYTGGNQRVLDLQQAPAGIVGL